MDPGLPLIVIAERQAPMRRAVRRLLGESRFAWVELAESEGLIEQIASSQPALVVLEDRMCGKVQPALSRLRALGCCAPVVLISTSPAEALPDIVGAIAPALVIDRLEISARLPEAARTLLRNAAMTA